MIVRTLRTKLKNLFEKFPVLAVLGPRQSGKTTLVQDIFPQLTYVNMEDLSQRNFALEDPKGFLDQHSDGMILDEVQHVPDLFSYIQVYVDKKERPGQYVLTGSRQFMVHEKISQSLAGRVALTTLLPLSLDELKQGNLMEDDVASQMFKGFYPRIYRYQIEPSDFYPSYIQTYIERDIRQIKNISDLALFQKFLKLCAGRVGQLLNLSSLANDCGISPLKAREWLSVLETSFITYLLKPHHKNFNKRLVKTPKLYFYDTGLLCSLLDIHSPEQLENHFARGAIFENLIIIEFLKQCYHQGHQPNFYFWRDKIGHEIDLIIDQAGILTPIEIKSGKTINTNFFSNLEYFRKLSGQEKAFLYYGGEESQNRTKATVRSWRDINYQEILTL